MKKQFTILSILVLTLSLSLIVLLTIGLNRQRSAAGNTALPLTDSRPALALVPTRPPSEVVALPTPTDSPTPLPTSRPTETSLPIPVEVAAAPNLLLASSGVNTSTMLANYCAGFGSPVSLRVFDWTTGSAVSLSDETIARVPVTWDASSSIWRGYDSASPFDQPADAVKHWKINLLLSDGRQRWIEVTSSQQTPGVYYLYAFTNTIPFATSTGEYFGYHPCRAFAFPADQFRAFLALIDQFQGVVRYPPLIPSSDPRWVRGSAQPVLASADLRSIPSTDSNDPISSIDRQVLLWFVLDPSWGNWAQVKLGAVQGWVDTQLVRLRTVQ